MTKVVLLFIFQSGFGFFLYDIFCPVGINFAFFRYNSHHILLVYLCGGFIFYIFLDNYSDLNIFAVI